VGAPLACPGCFPVGRCGPDGGVGAVTYFPCLPESAWYASPLWRAERALGPGGRAGGVRGTGETRALGGFPGFPGALQVSVAGRIGAVFAVVAQRGARHPHGLIGYIIVIPCCALDLSQPTVIIYGRSL